MTKTPSVVRGYPHTVLRLGGRMAQAAPLLRAPFAMDLLATAVAAVPAVFLASRRRKNVPVAGS